MAVLLYETIAQDRGSATLFQALGRHQGIADQRADCCSVGRPHSKSGQILKQSEISPAFPSTSCATRQQTRSVAGSELFQESFRPCERRAVRTAGQPPALLRPSHVVTETFREAVPVAPVVLLQGQAGGRRTLWSSSGHHKEPVPLGQLGVGCDSAKVRAAGPGVSAGSWRSNSAFLVRELGHNLEISQKLCKLVHHPNAGLCCCVAFWVLEEPFSILTGCAEVQGFSISSISLSSEIFTERWWQTIRRSQGSPSVLLLRKNPESASLMCAVMFTAKTAA